MLNLNEKMSKKIVPYLWGDYYFNPTTKTISEEKLSYEHYPIFS